MGLQELLLHLHPTVAICAFPLLLLSGLAALPFLQSAILPGGLWFGGVRGARLALLSSVAGFLSTGLAVVLDAHLLTDAGIGPAAWAIRGLVPLLVACLSLSSLYLLLRKRGYSRPESLMAVVLWTLAGIGALTVIGIWLRGPGMQLALPV